MSLVGKFQTVKKNVELLFTLYSVSLFPRN